MGWTKVVHLLLRCLLQRRRRVPGPPAIGGFTGRRMPRLVRSRTRLLMVLLVLLGRRPVPKYLRSAFKMCRPAGGVRRKHQIWSCHLQQFDAIPIAEVPRMHPHHPPDWKGSTWYRFTGGAGSRLAETRPGSKHCGTACAGYLFDGHPSVPEGIVSRTVYFECSSNAKYDPVSIEVLNCGDYYVYHLPDTPDCYEGFCGIE